jgi:hypothetical protein
LLRRWRKAYLSITRRVLRLGNEEPLVEDIGVRHPFAVVGNYDPIVFEQKRDSTSMGVEAILNEFKHRDEVVGY